MFRTVRCNTFRPLPCMSSLDERISLPSQLPFFPPQSKTVHLGLSSGGASPSSALFENLILVKIGDFATRVCSIQRSVSHARTAPLECSQVARPNNTGLLSSVRSGLRKKDGSALDPDVLRKDALYPILDRLGIPRRKGASGFHTFRHSAASIVNEQTGNLKLAQKFLGHSTIKMTADIYTHTSAEAERDAAIALERAIYGDLFPVVPNIENRNNFAALN